MTKKKILFDLKKEYYLNSLYPLYKEMSKDSNYDLQIRVGADQHRFLGIFLISNKSKIERNLVKKGFKVTSDTTGFDAIIVGDALKNPDNYDDVPVFHLDHGVGIKTLRIRNIVRQKNRRYHVFLEGQYWYDYIKSIHYENKADFHITGLPKLDPFFQHNFFNNQLLLEKLKLNPNKKTVLFAPSYKPSCISKIGNKIEQLLPDYNLIIKLHPYSWKGKYAPHSQHKIYQQLAKKHKDIYLVPEDEFDVYPYLFLADTLISDTSSVINEFLALNKFGIIYELNQNKLNHSDGMPVLSLDPVQWLKGAFPHINKPEQISEAVKKALNPTEKMRKKLKSYRDYFFTGLDGNASKRVKAKIDTIMEL